MLSCPLSYEDLVPNPHWYLLCVLSIPALCDCEFK